jgi:mono/diheme cytochrome c family protein
MTGRWNRPVGAARVSAHPTGLTILLVAAFSAATGAALAAADFAKEVEPILIKRCSECHGPDKQKGELRLDSKGAAVKPAKSGKFALVPGKPTESELLKRVVAEDPDEVMPPKGPRLTPAEVEGLRRWIAEGAVWPEANPLSHWAFQPIRRPAPPEVHSPGAVIRNDIDRFILARLEKEGLAQSPEADRATLIRRVSLDLTGLPPTWAEVEAFVHDASPDAYEKVVDRLLASSHFGENMARGWLDLARYADSNGYQVDLARSIWPYRDWVIRAFNDNKRFDAFTIEQLAGDLLPNATLDQRIATGFNRNTKINDEGGGDAEEYRVKAVKDRVATLGTAWLGLTLNCAECHSHKYDPVSQEEYYKLYAFFNNTTDGGNYSSGPAVEAPKPDLTVSRRHVETRIAEDRKALDAEERKLKAETPKWERETIRHADAWRVLNLKNPVSTGGSGYTNLPDGSLLATGVNPIYDTITVEAETDLAGVTAILLEVLPDPSLPKNGPGRWGQTGNFILDEFSATAAPMGGAGGETTLAFSGAVADWEQPFYRAEHAVDRNPKTGWAIGPKFGERHFLIARLTNPTGFAGGTKLAFRFDHYHGNSHTLGRFRLSVTSEKNPAAQWPVTAGVVEALRVKPDHRSQAQRDLLVSAQRLSSPEMRRLAADLHQLGLRKKQLDAPTSTTLVMEERSEPAPRVTRIHNRGNFLDQGREVTAGVPAVFPPLPTGVPPNRMALARWLVDPANPLPARVAVNRFWERCFGTGIVKTSEDFGRQGEPPSHVELIDWLASEFIRSGWDVKAMQKLIVMSASYRQSAATDAKRLEKDFYNRLISRGPRFRMDAELIRDHALVVSGLLNDQVGGPSVYPVQVPNLWKEIGFLRPEIGMDEWPVSEGPDLYRRGVYTFWRRVCTYPTYATYDAPSRDICVARRPRTNTPLQALAGLNDPTFLEAARVYAQRVLAADATNDAARVDWAFRNCVGRAPTAAEHARLVAYLDQQIAGFRGDRVSAETLVRIGSAPCPPGLEPRRLAAWMMVANVLFNLDETLTKG